MIKDFEKCVDKVYISKSDLGKIKKWWKDNAGTIDYNTKHFFPLTTFIIEIPDFNILALVELNNYDINDGHVTTDSWEGKWKRNYEKGNGWDKQCTVVEELSHSAYGRDLMKEYATDYTNDIMKTLFYIEAISKDRRKEQRISPGIAKKMREEYKYQDRELYMLRDIIEYSKIHPNRSSIKYRCECWGVRGHFRHYGTGQVLWIFPYKKGKKRDIMEPKNKTYLTDGSKEDPDES